MNDLKLALRQVLKNPGFTAVAVLTLGLRAAAADTTDASALLPVPRAIVTRHVEAIGGRAALLKHRSYHWTGGFELPDSKFVLPIHVPDWPADWNEMDEAYPPPTFAKQLPWPWKGEHSRWFTAKFDKPGDDFFWSYVVFNALEGDTLKSREELADALKRYDGSLYGDAFPPAKIRVAIGPDQDTWKFGRRGIRRSVTIDGFDAEG